MQEKKAYLLINTGSPESTKVKDVRKFLTAFLSDPRVMSIPKLARFLLVRGIIAPFRAPRSAEKYKLIWTKDGAPLTDTTEKLAAWLSDLSGKPVFFAMRYNEGSMESALNQAKESRVTELVAIPLIPHYAQSSFESTVAQVLDTYREGDYPFSLSCVRPYFDHPGYIQLLVDAIVSNVPPRTRLIFSYHSIPIKHSIPYKGDASKDYEVQCLWMTHLITSSPEIRALNLTHEVVFQSRFGKSKWLTPATDKRIYALAATHDDIAVICPSFVCDNLETSWEINIHERTNFERKGGGRFIFIPCPNASEKTARVLMDIAETMADNDIERWTKP